MTAILRLADARDAAAIAAIYAPYVETTPITFEEVAPTSEQMAARITGIDSPYPWLVACEGSDILGYAYSSRHRDRASYRWSVDVSVYIDRDHRRCGLGRALYTALLDLLSECGLARAYAGITLPNAASVRLHEAMGFGPVGIYEGVGYKMAAWRDVGWWTRPLAPASDTPREPQPLRLLIDDGRMSDCIERGAALLRR